MTVIPPAGMHRLRFAVFELDVRAGELRKAGRRVRLAGQPLQILELLVARPGEVVTREEIRQRLWPADTFVDFEHNLNSAVKRLRAALGDSADTPRFIETLPRRGYRFLVPVEVLDAGVLSARLPGFAPEPVAAQTAVEAALETPPVGERRPVPLWAVGVLALAAAIGLAAWSTRSWRTDYRQPIGSLAVLPFENLSNDTEQGYLADGMTEALITSLAQIKSLKVISRTSVMSYRSPLRPIREIGKELGVDAIVEGSLIGAGGRLRITAQLIDARTDRHVWAASYEGESHDVLALQGQVARAIAHEINASLSPPEAARLSTVAKVDPATHELYLRGRHLLTRRTEGELRRALAYFEEAVERDPTFALAHVGIAQTWDALASWTRYVAPKEGYPRAKAAALRALALDDTLAEAHAALAAVHELYDWDLPSAERRYERAIALNPNYAAVRHRYAQFLQRTGRRDAALAAALRARELDPLSVETNMGLAQRFTVAGKLHEALAQMQSASELDPTYFDAYVHIAEIHQRLGNGAAALAAAERGVALSERNAHALNVLAGIHLRQGNFATATAILSELEARPVRRNSYDIAMLYLEMEEPDKALFWLQQACEDRMPSMAFLKTAQKGRHFDAVRMDARFLEILRCVDTPAPAPR